ncbi:methyltransferase family protein [Albibacterium bauzanense]|uniref:Protein-S-isoprenylcysteine O-methyltransferase Ste14 n=1 Tax=Albibacterium bauzanense TaxID=653929 RepID=A0A4R1LYI9_9SPHI|nr:isoprenylcysteine carboxylmethyltransferase family protein [Albibacterium bauzanense]TCK83634.1 protein-S-isoprenylcysteine O-methyltransferase Ste14 [Albibacterium bauzanense]
MFEHSRGKDLIYVATQLCLLVAFILMPPLVKIGIAESYRKLALIPAISGVLISLVAILQLKSNLTPFPSPTKNGTLIQTGLYRYMRHPIYTGIIVFIFCYSLFSDSLSRLVVSVLLVVLFYFKSRYEEGLLLEKFAEYPAYKSRTGRFFPFL